MTTRLLILLLLLTGTICQTPSAQEVPEPVVIETEQSRIELTPDGAYPTAWTVQPLGQTDTPEALVESFLAKSTRGGPFRLVLDGMDGPLSEFANTTSYTVQTNGDAVEFTSGIHESGLQITKQLQPRDDYNFIMRVTLRNTSPDSPIAIEQAALTLGPGLGPKPSAIGGLGDAMYSFVEVVAYDGTSVHTIESIPGEQLSTLDNIGPNLEWIGLHNRYYAMLARRADSESVSGSVLSPEMLPGLAFDLDSLDFYPAMFVNGRFLTEIPAGGAVDLAFEIYAGPKDRDALTEAGYDPLLYSNLPGWLRWLCLKLGDLLRYMYGHIGSWWMTIVAFTVLIRIVLFPLAQKSVNMNAKMMADQAKLKPLIDEIKRKHKNAQTQYDKTMAVYKEHGINPLAPLFGCLPVLLQLPILIAIFNILGQEVTLQGARFLWIDDLSLPDRLFPLGFTLPYFGAYFNLLPVLMAVTMVLTTNLGSPADGDQKKSQTRSMAVLAFIFFALFYSFPAGLVLYWMLSNLGQYAQQEVTKLIFSRRAGAASDDATD